jgi:hypothetical protein
MTNLYTFARMPFLPDVSHARLLLKDFGGWFGPPCIRLESASGKLLDGRKRWTAWQELAFPDEPPTLVAGNRRDAGRLLVLAQHFERAAQVLGDSIPYDRNTAALLRVPPELGAGLVAQARKLHRKPRRVPRRRAEVINRLRRLYLDTIEHGHELKPADLRDVLGDWA